MPQDESHAARHKEPVPAFAELFVRELAAAVLDPVRARRKRLAKGHSPAAPPLFAYRRLDPAR